MQSKTTKNEAVKKAIKWISTEQAVHPELLLSKLVETAIFRFDLSPADADFLYRFYLNPE
jgi:hypothetical protein